jgi:hypothetical protein
MRAFSRVSAYFWGPAAGFQQSTRPFIFSDLQPHEIFLTVPSNVLPGMDSNHDKDGSFGISKLQITRYLRYA